MRIGSGPEAPFEIRRGVLGDAPLLAKFVAQLVEDLGGSAFERLPQMVRAAERFLALPEGVVLFASQRLGSACGVLTLVESQAVYAGGRYGIVNEGYVVPQWRSAGVGGELMRAAQAIAIERGWERLEVCAPRHQPRTIRFYETHGFHLGGPKLVWPENNGD